jgi:hypothetical protein
VIIQWTHNRGLGNKVNGDLGVIDTHATLGTVDHTKFESDRTRHDAGQWGHTIRCLGGTLELIITHYLLRR